LVKVRGIEAIVLGGSQARGTADEKSDIDLGIYYEPAHPFSVRDLVSAVRALDDRHAENLVTGFGEWGPGVNGGGWLIIGGRHVDLLYRDLGAVRTAVRDCFAGRVKSVHQLGHPLGFHNQIYLGEVNSCRPLHDPSRRIARLKAKVARYPSALRDTILRRHMFDARFELDIAEKAASRADVPYVAGCLFRATGFMLLVIYALNHRYFINEKGALAETRSFRVKPRAFESDVKRALGRIGGRPAELSLSIATIRNVYARLAQLIARL
ncbi:MAG: nucleotidyltransferase domain-containing protein, partial [Candidatus Binataceae bacterium]